MIKKKKQQQARLVAVSKYKPAEDLMYAYGNNQRHFGENYVRMSTLFLPSNPAHTFFIKGPRAD
jgi:hypothetical protein